MARERIPLSFHRINAQSAVVQDNLLLWGFHAKKFTFWNETTGELIFEHHSGGANRIWDFYVPATIDLHEAIHSSWLVYTSKSQVLPSG
jgi:hypothetical protein